MMLRILSDVAPYSREYQKWAGAVRREARGNPDLTVELERIEEQVRQTKESTLQIAQRHFNAPVDRIEGTVKSASPEGVELSEYPGRTFRFSSLGMKMADLVADELGRRNDVTRVQAVRDHPEIFAHNTRSLPGRAHKIPRARGAGPPARAGRRDPGQEDPSSSLESRDRTSRTQPAGSSSGPPSQAPRPGGGTGTRGGDGQPPAAITGRPMELAASPGGQDKLSGFQLSRV
jgi:hypothetical protein